MQTILVRPVEETIENTNPIPSEGSESNASEIPEKPTVPSENEIPIEKVGEKEE